MFRAVEIDGVPYWDGGYLGNPVLYPFFRATTTENVLIVQINPLKRKEVPKTNPEIMARVNEITFNSSLMAELRGLSFVRQLIDEGKLPRGTKPGEYRRINVHRIVLESSAQTLDAGTKLRTDYDFFELLRSSGSARRAASSTRITTISA